MNKNLLPVCILLTLTGCASERLIYQPVAVPAGLTQAVQKPLKPDPKNATQKDVGVFLIEQNATIDACNEQLKLIKKWSKQHEKNHQRTLRKPD